MSCIRGNYDLWVKQVSDNKLIYRDLSDWMETPESYRITVTKPGRESGEEMEVSAKGDTIIEPGFFNDGIYTFTTESCGIKYTRKKGIFYHLECCIIKSTFELSERQKDNLMDAQRMIRMMECAVDMQKFNLAEDLHDIVTDKLRVLNCDCSCLSK